MGKPAASAADQARNVVQGAFSSTGFSVGATLRGRFNATIWGTFAATMIIERSFDGGSVWHACTDNNAEVRQFSKPFTLVCEEAEAGVLYRFACKAYTSGTVNYRLSQ